MGGAAGPDFRAVFRALPGRDVLLAPSLAIAEATQGWLGRLGLDRDQIVGRQLPDVLADRPDADHAAIAALREKCACVVRDGRAEPAADWALIPLLDDAGAVAWIICHADGVGAAREAAPSEPDLATLAELASGMAHDFNNLLMSMIGSLELLSGRLTDEPARRQADTALAAAWRGTRLTRQLLAYGSRQRLQMQSVDANRLIANILDLVRRALGERVRLRTVLAEELWPVATDPTQLEMLLLNLALNARDAMAGGGQLTIATRNLPEGAADLPGELAPGPYVAISATDTGSGMAPDILARAREPFFTTKGPGKGNGLGLAQAHAVARQSGGTLRIGSAPGAGTTVEVVLPRCP